MSYSIILVYVCVWWLIFFIALPIGVKSEEKNKLNLGKKAFYVSLISLPLSYLTFLGFENFILSLL